MIGYPKGEKSTWMLCVNYDFEFKGYINVHIYPVKNLLCSAKDIFIKGKSASTIIHTANSLQHLRSVQIAKVYN